MHHVFGETVFQIERTELIQLGYLTPVTVQPVDTDFYYSYYGADDHTRMMTYLVEDADRNRLIIDLVKENVNRGHLCLILTGRVEHAEWLADSLTESGIECDLLLGKVKKSERQRIRQKALNGKLQAITATTVADEGLDIPNLSALFMTYPTRAAGKILQRVGRVMRPAPDKLDPVIYDFVDGRVGLLLSQYRKRLKAYDQLDARVLTPLNAGDRVFAL